LVWREGGTEGKAGVGAPYARRKRAGFRRAGFALDSGALKSR